MTGLFWQEGWQISRSRVERVWKQEGLKVPQGQPKRARLWLADGRAIKILRLIDEYTREALAIVPARRIRSNDVIDIIPEQIRSDNGPEVVATKLREWLDKLGTKTLYIATGSPCENVYCESVNGKLRNELLNGKICYTLREAQLLIEQWRRRYN